MDLCTCLLRCCCCCCGTAGYNANAMAARLKELEDEGTTAVQSLSHPYCAVILKYSSYTKPQRDKHFFELLIASLAAVLGEVFERLDRQPVIEQELGRLFRHAWGSTWQCAGPQTYSRSYAR